MLMAVCTLRSDGSRLVAHTRRNWLVGEWSLFLVLCISYLIQVDRWRSRCLVTYTYSVFVISGLMAVLFQYTIEQVNFDMGS